jgi:hypothetical protein
MSVRVAAVALAGLLLSVSPLAAQDLNGPANLPPAGFAGDQFVDNAGCAFARAGVSGNTVWVARVNQQRQQICGLPPSFGATAVAAAEAPARPAAADDPGPPIPTVASTAPAAPRPAAAPAAAPAPAAPVAIEEAPRRFTLAEACEGRTGIQPGLLDTRTGRALDCGGLAPAATVAQAPAAPSAPAPRTLTLAEACAEQASRGVTLINATTGAPVDCPATTVVASAPAPAPAPRLSPTFTTATVAATVAAQTRADPLSAATLSGNVAPGPVAPIRVGDVLSAETISGVVTQIHYGPPPGYEPVWTDGRINPNRGLPEIQAQVPVAAQPSTGERVSTMSAPQPQAVATGGFVQVGIFGDPSNAARAEATLRGLGLPVSVSTLNRDGRMLQVVAAGPIAASGLDAALRAARAAGYGDAYLR